MGNSSSSKSSPKKSCSFCHRTSCSGDSCKYFYRTEPATSSSSVAVHSYSSVAPAVGRSTSGTQPVISRGWDVANHDISRPGATLAQGSGSVATKVPQSGSTVQQSNAGGISSRSTYASPLSTNTATTPQSGISAQQSNASGTSSRSTYAGPLSTNAATKPQSGISAQQSNASGTSSRSTYAGPLSTNAATKPLSGSSVQPSNASGTNSRTTYGPVSTTISASHNAKQISESNKTSYGGNAAHLAVQGKPLPFSDPFHFSIPKQDVTVTANLPNQKNLDPLSINLQGEGAARNIYGTGERKSTKTESSAPPLAYFEMGKPIVELNSLDVKKQQTVHVGANQFGKGSCASTISKSSSNAEVTSNERKPKHNHSPHAVQYEGVVLQIIGSRHAKVRVYERNGMPVQRSEWEAANVVHKDALLVVDKLINNESGSFYPSKTVMRELMSKGDVVELICTAHNNQSSGFHLYAHEAWLTGQRTQINDSDSVASFISKSGSDTQESTSSKTKKNKIAQETNKTINVSNENSCDSSDVVNQWLDSNKYCLNKNESSKPLKLIGGCHYIGKAVEIRSSNGLVVEISSKDGRQFVFVLPNYFYPQGISGPALSLGTSLESCVNIGDEIVVIPIRNVAADEGKFEWVASKAWPKNIQSAVSTGLNNKKQSELIINAKEGQNQLKDFVLEKTSLMEKQTVDYIKSLYPSAKNWKEFDGEILSLQYDWGLVKEKVNSQTAYAFTRKNTYLLGLPLEHFILDDVFKMGQSVKFSVDIGEAGTMHALAVWSGNKFPDYNSFDIATGKYCEEHGIRFATEESLIQHGKTMYLGH